MELSTTKRGGRSGETTTPSLPTAVWAYWLRSAWSPPGTGRIHPSLSSVWRSSSTNSAWSKADFQAESQCCNDVTDSDGGSGGNRTLQAGMGWPMPSGTPSCRNLKKSISGSRTSTERQCQRLRRKGCPGSTCRRRCQTSSRSMCRKARRSARKGCNAVSERGASFDGETRCVSRPDRSPGVWKRANQADRSDLRMSGSRGTLQNAELHVPAPSSMREDGQGQTKSDGSKEDQSAKETGSCRTERKGATCLAMAAASASG